MADASQAPEPVPLLEPREGLPPVVVTSAELRAAADRLAGGDGPVAVDAERASGYRYGQRAYLVQLRRAGAGTTLVDPVPLDDLDPLATALDGPEWVLHAASQDLPCLGEIGLRPARLFDTELAGRLAGFERVGLAALVAQLLGYHLEKGHAAVDWSRRPLPEPWLRYAALDVEVLVDLRDALEEELRRQGKLDWALEEFAALLCAPPPAPRADPWRRTSGIHRVRGRRALATVRALWELRDELARELDLSPGRVLPDAAIVAAASTGATSTEALAAIPGFTGRNARRHLRAFAQAAQAATRLPDGELPAAAGTGDGPPPVSRWRERDPQAAARLARAREALTGLAEKLTLPVENLLGPDAVRRLAWEPPAPGDDAAVAARLRELGARDWQLGLAVPELTRALSAD